MDEQPKPIRLAAALDAIGYHNADSLLALASIKSSALELRRLQNLNCKSTQARLATLWGYERPQPKREPLTDDDLCKVFPVIATYTEANKALYKSIARAIERAHGIGGEE